MTQKEKFYKLVGRLSFVTSEKMHSLIDAAMFLPLDDGGDLGKEAMYEFANEVISALLATYNEGYYDGALDAFAEAKTAPRSELQAAARLKFKRDAERRARERAQRPTMDELPF